MKSAKIIDGKIEIIDVEIPKLDGKGAIIKVFGCGLCGSDVVKFLENKPNTILGHEVVGEIVELNSDCDFKIGDRVALGHHYPCFDCEYCKNESYSMCPTFKSTNIYPCGFSEFIFVSEGHLKNTVFKLPSDMSDETASFLEPLACCIRAIKRCGYENLSHKQNSLVIGLGSIGNIMGQALKCFRADAYGLDINTERQKLGNKFFLEFDKNIKYDSIFMTSGASSAIKTAMENIKNGGKIIVFSSIKSDLGYLNNDIYYKELSVIGSYSPSPNDLKLSFEFLRDRKVQVEGFTTIYDIKDLADAFCDTINNKIFKAYIKL